MPATLTYPGVYIEEIPSGVRTITGVATSITAFIGRALRGPTNEAVVINSFGDFERIFGGLWVESTLGYAVRDFYLNGGSQAVIVRLYHAESGAGAKPAKSTVTVGDFTFEAASEGQWGNKLRATIDTDVSEEVATRMGLAKADLFNLTVRDATTGMTEVFRNLSVKPSSRRLDKVLAAESRLVRWAGIWPPNPLPAIAADVDTVAIEEKKLADEQKELAVLKATQPQDPAAIAAQEAVVATAKADLKTAEDAAGASDGLALTKPADFTPANAEADKKGLYSLEQLFAKDGLFNILCIPPYMNGGEDVDVSLVSDAAAYCEKRRAMLLVDPPSLWKSKQAARDGFTDANNDQLGTRSKNAAIFFPRLRQPNPLRDNQFEVFAPCGAVAGVFARTDTRRGVWKAPAGLDATLVGVPSVSVALTDDENGELNQLGINCLRAFPAAGRVVWGSRTLRGADQLADEWKYIPVRRTALFIEESLYRGTQWVVFEPNDEPLWSQIRLNIGAFMQNLFRQGAFQGTTPKDAYFVKCDKETTTQNDINLGIVNIIVGFAPLKPAEFVVIKIQQIAGKIET
jgi:phage tail sheath protein FI